MNNSFPVEDFQNPYIRHDGHYSKFRKLCKSILQKAKGSAKNFSNVDDETKDDKLKEINDICLAVDYSFSLLLHRFASEPDAAKKILDGMMMLGKNDKVKRMRDIFVASAGGTETAELVPNITLKKLQEIVNFKTDKIAMMDRIINLRRQQPSETDIRKSIYVY